MVLVNPLLLLGKSCVVSPGDVHILCCLNIGFGRAPPIGTLRGIYASSFESKTKRVVFRGTTTLPSYQDVVIKKSRKFWGTALIGIGLTHLQIIGGPLAPPNFGITENSLREFHCTEPFYRSRSTMCSNIFCTASASKTIIIKI